MKRIVYVLTAMALLLSSCNKENNIVDNLQETASVTVKVNDFSISMEDIDTRAQDVANYNDIKAVTLAFYDSNNAQVYQATQVKGDGSYTTFGNFTCNLPYGKTYTLVVVGRSYYDGDVFSLTSPTSAGYTSERPRETFCATQSVTVTGAATQSISVTMSRVMAQVFVQSTDGRLEQATKIRTTYAKGSKSFSPTTGLATDDDGYSQFNNPSAAVGSTVYVFSNVFLTSDEETMDITIQVLDADDNVLRTTVVKDVPLKRNRKTTLRGPLYSSALTSSFQVEAEWLTSNEVPF